MLLGNPRAGLLPVVALALSGCVNDSTRLADQDAGTPVPDAGSGAAGCGLPTVQLADRIAHNLQQHAPIDLRVLDTQVYVTWIDGEDLVLATLDSEGEVIRHEVLGQLLVGKTPRIFFRQGRGPAVVALHRDREDPIETRLSAFDGTGAIRITSVVGDIRFGIDADKPTTDELPPMALAVRTQDASFLEVRPTKAAVPQRANTARLFSDWAIEIAALDNGFSVLLGAAGEFEYFTTDPSGISTEPAKRLSGLKSPFVHDFRLRTDDVDQSLVFYPDDENRMASVGLLDLNDRGGEPIIVQRRAGIFDGFGIAVDRGATGWTLAWSDFRDTFNPPESNQYAARNLYFKDLSDTGLADEGTARLLVDGEGEDLNFARLGHLPDGRQVAAYLRGYDRPSLHVVIGDFSSCPARPPHPFQVGP